ncbi:hypothetical protein ScPMuIL_000331 [Solemya velum]
MSSSINDHFFSIDSILATQERLPCKVELPIFRLGYLDSATDGNDLLPGTKLEMPFWMAQSLCSRRRHIISIELPKQYRGSYREILDADANVVDLHKMGPYYYAFGTQLLRFDHADGSDIAKSLLMTFQMRFRKIMDSSRNSFNEDTCSLTNKLDETERSLFKAGQKELNDFQRWETRETEKLMTSKMVRNHRKRKRAALEEIS